jgi:prephenate dehydrogenase
MSRPRFKKAVILGVGLLGGSIALALRKKRLASQVWGFGKNPERLRAALKRGVLTHAAATLPEACAGADLIILCTPFTLFESLLKKVALLAPASCLVTDVGSVKGAWVGRWQRAAMPLRFIASHPMAGSENSGWEHARADLFEGAPCILCPIATSSKPALAKISSLWAALGCRIQRRSPAEHDRLIGRFSHLTHALAFSLFKTAGRGLKKSDYALAGPSFWQNTRVAGSDPGLWADIFEYNRVVLKAEISAATAELKRLGALKGGALRRELAAISAAARRARP